MKNYQFAILRYTFSVFAGETVNVGLVMWVPEDRALLYRVSENFGRLSLFFKDGFSGQGYRNLVRAMIRRLADARAGAIEDPELFNPGEPTLNRFLAAVKRGGCFVASETMGGIAEDPAARFEELYAETVLRHVDQQGRQERDDEQVMLGVTQAMERAEWFPRLRRQYRIETPVIDHTFPYSWQNGALNVLEGLSFELRSDHGITDKAIRWYGVASNLAKGGRDFLATLVVAPPLERGLASRYDKALRIIQGTGMVREIIEEREASDRVMGTIARDLAEHPQ